MSSASKRNFTFSHCFSCSNAKGAKELSLLEIEGVDLSVTTNPNLPFNLTLNCHSIEHEEIRSVKSSIHLLEFMLNQFIDMLRHANQSYRDSRCYLPIELFQNIGTPQGVFVPSSKDQDLIF